VISIVACCHGAKLCAYSARDFRSQQWQGLEQSPRKSTTCLSWETDLLRSLFLHIIQWDLHLLPYYIQILQFQTDANKAESHAFGQTISQRIKDHPGFLNFCLKVMRETFHLNGHVIKWNMRFWTQAQPHELQQQPLGLEIVTMQSALGRNDTMAFKYLGIHFRGC